MFLLARSFGWIVAGLALAALGCVSPQDLPLVTPDAQVVAGSTDGPAPGPEASSPRSDGSTPTDGPPAPAPATCPAGQHPCAGRCRADGDPTACGPSCEACTAPANAHPLCLDGSCKSTCNDHFHRCNQECVDSTKVETCGYNCSPCTVPAINGTPSCEASGLCSLRCDAGFFTCPTSVPSCQPTNLGFESGTDPGFTINPNTFAARGPPVVSTARASSGRAAMAVTVLFPGTLAVEHKFCDYATPVDLFNRRLSARFFFEGPTITPGAGRNQVTIEGYGYDGSVASELIAIRANEWQTHSVVLNMPSAHQTLSVVLDFTLDVDWAGTVYVDDVRLE